MDRTGPGPRPKAARVPGPFHFGGMFLVQILSFLCFFFVCVGLSFVWELGLIWRSLLLQRERSTRVCGRESGGKHIGLL